MAKRRLPPGDDGRTIIPMDVPGMPWHEEDAGQHREERPVPSAPPLSGRETRWMIFGSLKAALLIVGVFTVGIVLFILLLLAMWK